jgi:hypothetical protein
VVRKGQKGTKIVAPAMGQSDGTPKVVNIKPADVFDMSLTEELARRTRALSVLQHAPRVPATSPALPYSVRASPSRSRGVGTRDSPKVISSSRTPKCSVSNRSRSTDGLAIPVSRS